MASKPKIKRWPARPKPKSYGQQPRRLQKIRTYPSRLTQGTSSGDGNGGGSGGGS